MRAAVLPLRKKRFYIIIFLILSGLCFSAFAAETKFPPLKIKVGFFGFDGYHNIDADGTKSGYGYDFLQMIAPYANFEYEYIGYDKSWTEIKEMLAKGEIDLLTSSQKSPANKELFDYSERCIGFSATLVTTRPSNTNLTTSDYSTFEGIHIGMLESNSRNNSFDSFAKSHGFSYVPVYFRNQKVMQNALKNGEIAAIVTSDLRVLSNEIIVAKFDDSPFYAITKKGNAEIMERVNYAIEMLNSDSPSWIHTLFYKHYNNIYAENDMILSSEERNYLFSLIQENRKLKIILNPDRAPYSYYENKVPKGIFVDLLERIADSIDLNYELVYCETVAEYENKIRAKIPDIVFGSVMDNFTGEEMGYHITNSFHTTSLSCVTRTNDSKAQNRVAVNEGMSILNRRYNNLYGDREQVKFKTIKECMQAVKSGKADCTYAYTYTAAKFIFEDLTGSLSYTPVTNTLTNVGIAIRNDESPILFHLMNRIAENISEDKIQPYIANHTNFTYNGNPIVYGVYKYPINFSFIFVCIISVITSLIIFKRNKEKKMALLLLQQDAEKRKELEVAYDAAEKANRAKSDFLSKMSHDIRTPMNAIVGLTAIAQSHINEPDKITDYLSKITSSSKHLLGLINDVLDMSKIESGTFSLSIDEFNIVDLINQLVEIVTPDVNNHEHTLEVKLEDLEHKCVVGDNLHIQQVFVNIVSNSIKYTPNGGKLSITVREHKSAIPMVGQYEFIFSDNGMGISKEFLGTIFEPFTREKDSRINKIQGTGLGLAITKSIINMMDGTINIESEVDKGTTTTIILNLKLGETLEENSTSLSNADDSASSKPTPLAVFEKLDYSGKKVLLVDDNEINREIAREILGMTGLEIDEAENGKIAVEKFAESADSEYAMIFMDVQMPVMSGHTATLHIRNLDRSDAKTIPIIAMTADAFTEDIEKAIECGMNEHIAKPLDIKKLSTVMQKWLK